MEGLEVPVGDEVGAEGDLEDAVEPRFLQGPDEAPGGRFRKAAGNEGARSAYFFPGPPRMAFTPPREEVTRLAPWEQTFTQ